MKYAAAISPLAMNAAMPVKRPIAISSPQTSSMPPATFINGGNGPLIPVGIGGHPRSFCVPCIANMSPDDDAQHRECLRGKSPDNLSHTAPPAGDGVHVARQPGATIAPHKSRRIIHAHPRSHHPHRHSSALRRVQPQAGRDHDRIDRHDPADGDRHHRDGDGQWRAGDEHRRRRRRLATTSTSGTTSSTGTY